MDLVKLKEVAEIVSGSTPKTNKIEYWDGQIHWITPADLEKKSNGYIYSTSRKITDKGFESSNLKMLPVGTVLLTTRAPIGKVALAGVELCTNQGFKNIICDSAVLASEYLYYYLTSQHDQLNALGRGATFKEISKKIVEDLIIPLPPLQTQQKIVQVLDKAQSLIDKRKEQIELMDELIQSTFYEMFGDPVVNEKAWITKKVGSQLERIISGWSVSGEERKKINGEIAVLKISSVTSGAFKPDEHKVANQLDKKKVLVKPLKGDILFSRANTRELVAASCIVEDNYDDLFLPDKLWKIVIDSKKLSNYWFNALLQNNSFRATLTKQASGTSGSMLNISKNKFENSLMPVPPIEFQKQFADIVQKIEAQKQLMEQALTEMENNYNSLMQRAFKGEIM
ncbi:restriction endonuclease subunit S [Anoxynatronum buryatiense]|uniref:Type I restriction enzyme, S subunit n=1 Tax=Anoxynatronum buryatiense TaxID=489973 RepID=A0AA45WYZ7_9CLOT|nr:restriction endonuclease subunit S [Anoxynatronum buryatiense]SMP71387.1 type I restriction enzyme, S subunit [Anoxynatronum buryatiense]